MTKGRAVFRTYVILGRILSWLPEPAALGVAGVAGDVLFRVRHAQRTMVTRNLRRVLGPEVDGAALDNWAHRAFRSYARYWVEGARLGTTSPDEVVRHMAVDEGFAHLEEGMASGRGVVLALPHLGSWEYGGAYLAAKGYPMTAVAEQIEPPELFDHFVAERAAMGLTVVPLGADSGGAVIRTLRAGGLVGLLCERDLAGTGVDVEFFGEKTTMPAGPATVALRTGAMLTTAAVFSGPGRDHHATVAEPIDTTRCGSFRSDVQRITQEIATRFEVSIRSAPDQWHMFQPLWPVDRPDPGDSSGSGVGPGRGPGGPAVHRDLA